MFPLRIKAAASLILFGLTLFFSWNYISGFYYVGSRESATALSKRPAIVDWSQYSNTKVLKDYLIADTFLNYEDSPYGFKKDASSTPASYIKTDSLIYPVNMLPRISAMPMLLMRTFSNWISPFIARPLFLFLCVALSLGLAWLYIERVSGKGLIFLAIAATSPQIYYFNFSQYPDMCLSFAIFVLILNLLHFAQKKWLYAFIGFLFGLCLFIKVFSGVILLGAVLIYWSRIKDNWKAIALGFSPWVIIFGLVTDFGHISKTITSRDGAVPFYEVLTRTLIEFSAPDLQLKQSMYLAMPLWRIFFTDPVWLIISLVSLTWILYQVFKNGLTRRDSILLTCIFFFQLAAYKFSAKGLDTDLFSYLSQTYFVMLILFLGKFNSRKNLVRVSVVLFALIKLTTVYRWHKEFKAYTVDMNYCGWVYDCMYRDEDLRDLIHAKKVVTLNYLDVGQMEFLSREKVIPIHLYSSGTQAPSAEMVLSFLENFPEKNFILLSSSGLDGKSLEDYFGPKSRDFLSNRGINVFALKHFYYPQQLKSYDWLMVSKK